MIEFSTFWNLYPTDLSQNKKGPKSQAEKSWNKIPESKKEHVITCIRELIRHARTEQKSVGKTDRWPFASTWLNQERFENLADIESYTSLKERAVTRFCACKQPVTHIDKCDKCFHEEIDKKHDTWLYANLCSIGLAKLKDESKEQFWARHRAIHKKAGTLG